MNVPFSWPEKALADLRQWKALGWSSNQIAKQLSAEYRAVISRNAVIGKCMRMGIPTMSKEAVSATVRSSNARRAAKPVKEPAAVVRLQSQAVAIVRGSEPQAARKMPELAEVKPEPVHPDTIAVAPCCIEALTLASCRWPLERTTGHGEILFCNNPKAETGSYCEAHAKRAFAKTQTKPQKLAASVERDRNKAAFRASGGRDGHVFGFGMSKRFA